MWAHYWLHWPSPSERCYFLKLYLYRIVTPGHLHFFLFFSISLFLPLPIDHLHLFLGFPPFLLFCVSNIKPVLVHYILAHSHTLILSIFKFQIIDDKKVNVYLYKMNEYSIKIVILVSFDNVTKSSYP